MPSLLSFVGIEVYVVRNFALSVDKSDLVDRLDFRGESSVDAEHLAVNDRAQRQVVEHLRAVLVGVLVTVLSDNLVVESVPRVQRGGGGVGGLCR